MITPEFSPLASSPGQSFRSNLRGILLLLALLTMFSPGLSFARSALAAADEPVGNQAQTKARTTKEKPYALIYGTVWGPDDQPVYGITVKIRRANEKKARWEVSSNHTGEFAQRVPAGKADYVVWADVKGLKWSDGRHLQPGEPAQVHVEYDERVDMGLHLK